MEQLLAETWAYLVSAGAVGIGGAIVLGVKRVVERLWRVVSIIEREFTNNGGSSIKDAVDRIDRRVTKINGRQRALADSFHEPRFEVDHTGAWVWVSTALQHLAQCGPDAFMGSEWENMVIDSDRDRVWDEWCAAVERSRTFESQFRIRSTSGQTYKVDCIASPITDEGRVTGWLGTYRSVEELKPAKRATKQQPVAVN